MAHASRGVKTLRGHFLGTLAQVVYGASAKAGFICKVAETPEEVSELIEAGFDYVTDLEDKKFFRKRK